MSVRTTFASLFGEGTVAVDSIQAELRQMAQLHRSPLATSLVQQAYREHLDQQRYLSVNFQDSLHEIAREFENLQAQVLAQVGPERISALQVALREFESKSQWYFSALAEQLSPKAAMLRGLAEQQIPEEHVRTLGGFGAGSSYLGEFSYGSTVEDLHAGPNSDANLLEVVQPRLVEVNYLPARVFEEVRKTPELMKGLDDRKFEEFCAELLHKMGLEKIILTPRSSDGGRDIIAVKSVHGIPILFAFECKRYRSKIGVAIMRSLLGSVAYRHTLANKGVLLTTASFTRGSKLFIAQEPRVDGRDFDGLVQWIKSIQ